MEACTALSRRIAWCERMMENGESDSARFRYFSEMVGLLGEKIPPICNVKCYQRGLSDRATLLKLEDTDDAT